MKKWKSKVKTTWFDC